jgi:hypothetical protein
VAPPKPKIVCLDFDDTLCDHHKQLLPHADDVLAELRAKGHTLLVSSARFSPIYGDLNVHRIKRVQDWLDAKSLEVDAVCRFVPLADVYVDDLAHCFVGSWDVELKRVLERLSPGASTHERTLDKQVNVSLDLIWSGEEQAPMPGAVSALEALALRGVRVVVSAGPFIDPDNSESTRALRDTLKGSGLRIKRVDTHKITSDVYLNARGLRYEGDWRETAAELFERLSPISSP